MPISNQGRLAEALASGLESLAALGIEFPQAPSKANFAPALAKVKTLIGDRQPAELANLPQIQDPIIQEALILLVKITTVTYLAAPTLFPLIVFKQIELSMTYGNAPASAFSYSTYGMILCGILEEFTLGYEYGQLGLKLLSKFNTRQFETAILVVVYHYINHWKIHLREMIEPLQRTFMVGLETGDLSFSGYASHFYCRFLYLTGQELSETERELECHHQMIESIGQGNALNFNRVFLQTVLNLRGKSDHPHQLMGKAMDERALIPYYQNAKNEIGLWLVYVLKATLCYLFEKTDEALKAIVSAQQYLTATTSHPVIPIQYFYESLIQLSKLLETEKNPGKISNSNVLAKVRNNKSKLKYWAKSAPMNYLHKFYLVEAEYHRLIGEKAKAIEFYNLAITKAKENEYIQEEALAKELTAKFYLNWGQEEVARFYMMDAQYCYSRWGAMAKVKHLEANYSQLCQSSTVNASAPTTFNTRTTSNSTDGEALDVATVIKSTTAISGEIVLDKLLATLMNIIVENAGSQRGILILQRSGSLFIEAIKEGDLGEVEVLQSLPLDEFEEIAKTIVHYVARTCETIVLNDAIYDGNFTDDIYIQKCQCRSLACMPLINRSKLQGIIYLENNLTAGAFTQDRMILLRALATQAAISLENAQLYDNITTLNVAYKHFIPDQFLNLLAKESIVDVKLGDQVQQEMTILFSDIRDFTTISEQMSPAENFAFINEYLSYMEPLIQKHGGFIDKYIGDAIMALFAHSADDALKGAISMLQALKTYNQIRRGKDLAPLRIGIGLHTGLLMLGTVGGAERMDGTAIGDAVNLSSRVEGLTKTYRVSLLITYQTLARLKNPLDYDLRFVDKAKAKGKTQTVDLFEVFSADPPDLREAKIATKAKFDQAVRLYRDQSFQDAARLFKACVDYHPGDYAARSYLERCHLEIS